MAKIELHVTAEDAADFYDTLTALARTPAPLNFPQAEQNDTLTAMTAQVGMGEQNAPRRQRRTKAQIEADNAAQAAGPTSLVSSDSATTITTTDSESALSEQDSGEPEITLEAINAKMRVLMGGNPGASAKVQEIVKQATNGKYGSPKQAFLAGDTHFFPTIMAGLEALEAA